MFFKKKYCQLCDRKQLEIERLQLDVIKYKQEAEHERLINTDIYSRLVPEEFQSKLKLEIERRLNEITIMINSRIKGIESKNADILAQNLKILKEFEELLNFGEQSTECLEKSKILTGDASDLIY